MSPITGTKVKEIFTKIHNNLEQRLLHPDQIEIIIDEATKHINEVWPQYQHKDISHDELLFKGTVFAEYLANMIEGFERGDG